MTGYQNRHVTRPVVRFSPCSVNINKPNAKNTTKSRFPVRLGLKEDKHFLWMQLKLKVFPSFCKTVYQIDRSIAPGGGVYFFSDGWETFGPKSRPLWRTHLQISLVMIHGWDSVECRSLRLWKKQELPDTRPTFMVCFWAYVLCDELSLQAVWSSLSPQYPRSWQKVCLRWKAAD